MAVRDTDNSGSLGGQPGESGQPFEHGPRVYEAPSGRVSRARTVEVEDDPPPSNAEIDGMIDQLDAADMREALRDLARGIALEWNTNGESAARQALSDWLATAEVLADPESLTALLAARQSVERGEGTPWEELRADLGL